MAVGAPREAPASTAPLERVKKLQLQIASSTDLNPLAHLIKEARTLHSKLTQGNAGCAIALASVPYIGCTGRAAFICWTAFCRCCCCARIVRICCSCSSLTRPWRAAFTIAINSGLLASMGWIPCILFICTPEFICWERPGIPMPGCDGGKPPFPGGPFEPMVWWIRRYDVR